VPRPRFIVWRRQDRAYLPLVAVLAVVLISTVTLFFIAFSSGKVEGDSMNPTLLNGDHVLITKSYTVPRRGDVISVLVTDGTTTSHMIKRVIAIPGDIVTVVGDVAYVNDQPSDVAPQAIIGGSTIRYDPYVVAPGEVFVLGDNRPVSLDSRFVGAIRLNSIRGRVIAVFSPVTRMRRID
jgi:signal peptidase I